MEAAFRDAPTAPPPPPEAAAAGMYTKDSELELGDTGGEAGWVDLSGTPFGRRFRVHQLGSSSDKPALLLVPGTGCDLQRPSVIAALLSPFEKDFRVLSLDQRNVGETRPFTWEADGAGEGFSHIAAYADDAAAVAGVVFGAGQKFYVAGFSSGASTAMWVGYRYPERVLGIANIAGGFYQDRMVEFGAGGFDDLDKLTGEEAVWVRALLAHDHETVARHSNTQLKPGSPALKTALQAIEAENNALREKPWYDRAAEDRCCHHLQVAVRVCGSPPKEGLEKVAARTFIAGGRFDGMHKLARMRDLKKIMPAATLEMFPAAHYQVCIYAADKIAAFFKALP